jgi:hypothetical protein
MQLELHVQSDAERSGLQNLYARLMGAPGILHVTVDADADVGEVLVDFSPQRTSRQDIENIIAGDGYKITSSEVRERAHRHCAVAFLKGIFNK